MDNKFDLDRMDEIVDEKLDEIFSDIIVKDENNPAEILSRMRRDAKITFRELGGILHLGHGDLADIEHERVKVTEELFIGWMFICMGKIITNEK